MTSAVCAFLKGKKKRLAAKRLQLVCPPQIHPEEPFLGAMPIGIPLRWNIFSVAWYYVFTGFTVLFSVKPLRIKPIYHGILS